MPKKYLSLEDKLKLYARFKQSSMSKATFSEQNGVSKSAFTRWVSEIESEQRMQKQAVDNLLKPIVSLANQEQDKPRIAADNKPYIEFIMPNNIIIKLPINKDIQLLVEILQAIII